mmetsp:Transcript_42684/g.92098  ORF Transcript_42684/g.92098 Transcript_42684/m.92098 type:complete len:365 (-) Transcript_42684:74-1168(-)
MAALSSAPLASRSCGGRFLWVAARSSSSSSSSSSSTSATLELPSKQLAALSTGDFAQLLKLAREERDELRDTLKRQGEETRRRMELLERVLQDQKADSDELREKIAHLRDDLKIFSDKATEQNIGTRVRIQRKGVQGRGGQSRMAYRPGLQQAEKQQAHVCELNHESLAELAMLGNHPARRERLIREIMCVDQISWSRAHEVLYEFDKYKERYYWIETFPYRLGIAAAIISGAASVALVFWPPVAYWYGTEIAGEELPEDTNDISELTINQVGTWTWSWMEPMIGTATFIILCCQSSRAQMAQMNMRTYGDRVLGWRADRVANKFPIYDRSMVRAWSRVLPEVEHNFFPTYERHYKVRGPTSGL